MSNRFAHVDRHFPWPAHAMWTQGKYDLEAVRRCNADERRCRMLQDALEFGLPDPVL